MIRCIVCAIDGSEHSDKAAELASDLAARYDAKLCFLHVFMKGVSLAELERFSEHAHLKDILNRERERLAEFMSTATPLHDTAYIPPPSAETITRIAKVILEDARLVAESKSIENVGLATADGDPAEQILKFAETQEADMIVMGTRGLGGFKSLLLGSTSQKVGHLAHCTFVTVK